MITVIHINGLDERDTDAIRFNSSIASSSSGSSSSTVSESEDEGFSENSIQSLITIKGPTGSVRGFKHCVRQTITSFYNNFISKFVIMRKKKEIFVFYIQLQWELYETLLKIVEKRDIYVNSEFRNELEQRLKQIIVPCLFVNGKYFGDVESIERLNECGKLTQLLIDFKVSSKLCSSLFKTCVCCGNARFIPCSICHGSKKSFIHHFTTDSITLRCSRCNATGLIKCQLCYQ
ncbi:glutaredoxin domain-containing cysteine-rich protein-like protein [Leptotrombidium deliense]|uniref:Glutaredoxin domain-containing cysteine-rich protein-like protein n=1 Tax=Leptotrombidium deliense TaxID=299467 RepID=A0A443SDP6_9ACAR|nr:glutaredoxin domain-containing cysteine-rich protein-like protein [Leptotrombidium deliense]